MTKPLALAVRKELLVARASLERAELVRALTDLDRRGSRSSELHDSRPALAVRRRPLLSLFDRARPSASGRDRVAAGRLRRTVAGRWAMRGLALGAAVIGVVWVLGRKDQRD
jgi:hypothetical protein